MCLISLCMIARDEEKRIGRCLQSAGLIADELVVADTGSTDGTKSVCGRCGAKVADYEWNGDFAAARNFALTRATGDWILWLDADEELAAASPEALKQSLRDCAGNMVSLQLTHFYGAPPASLARAHVSSAFRLFRNGAGIRFAGRVHERLETGEEPPPLTANRLAGVLHYGYMDDELGRKRGRNMELLLKEKELRPDDAWLDYHLAAEYHHRGEAEQAYRHINASILRFLSGGLLPPSLAYKLKYDIIVAADEPDAFAGIEKAIQLYPDYVDLHYDKGLLLMRAGDYGKAAQAFAYCLVLGDAHPEHLVLRGAGSFLALYQLGRCREEQGGAEEAEEAYRQALRLAPDLEPAARALERLNA